MKDVVLTCCRDEADIIDTFVDFYLEMGFDEIYIVDNGSIDATAEIVNALIHAGKPVHLKQDPRIGYERFLTEYYLWAGNQANPRWLFFLDCDEFILFPFGVKKYFADLDPGINCLCLQQREMFPRLTPQSSSPIQGEFLLTTRTEPTFNDTTKDATKFHEDARVYAGKHLIEFSGKCQLTPNDIFIRHYKYRTLDQARQKERNRVQAQSSYSYEELTKISAFGPNISLQWFDLCRKGQVMESWRKYFTVDLDASEDHGLAKWAEKFLQRRALLSS